MYLHANPLMEALATWGNDDRLFAHVANPEATRLALAHEIF
jgi:hypothetical protein